MIRGFAYWFLGGIVTLLWGLMHLLVYPFLSKRQDLYHKSVGHWARFLLRVFCGVHLEVEGLGNIRSGRSYIIVSNHRSYTDILVGNASLRTQFRWLAKKSLFGIPVIGWSMHFAGYIPVVRERAVSASKSLDRTAEVLQSGVSVWIFPEGTRTPELKLGSFKRGAFRLARETGVSLLPVVLAHTERIFPRPCIIRPQRVSVIVMKPLDPAGFIQNGMSERAMEEKLMNTVRDVIQRTYDARTSRPS